ncbi:unnamed protein product [Hermetia illucens]|uniref:BPTI/Kunitz inhibitor domain-containing protein n=3 Tax=Hermetia illucens TaxID=343691 RepID=A0A7R8UEI3_HERIL|nr:unnamed protein product [Hermetia illucens]
MKVNIFIVVFGLIWSMAAGMKQGQCSLQKAEGDCYALIPRFYYNAESNECLKFHYGGCGGNDNNFLTKEECEKACKE